MTPLNDLTNLIIGFDPASPDGDVATLVFAKGAKVLSMLTGEAAEFVQNALQENKRLRETLERNNMIAGFIHQCLATQNSAVAATIVNWAITIENESASALGINPAHPNE